MVIFLVAAGICALWSAECSLSKHLSKTDRDRALAYRGANLWGLLAMGLLVGAAIAH